MSITMTFILGSLISDLTLFTVEVFPIRRGDMRITFMPFSRSFFSRAVSLILPVKLSPSTDIP